MVSVSVAMATYNGQKHIWRQLESVAAQSQIPAELVITDDNSADDTVAIIESFSKRAPFPVNVYRNASRLGYRANFMRAASLCQSELIAFCDQDDYWYPQKIAVSAKPFSDPEVFLVYHNADVISSDGSRIGSLATRAAAKTVLMPLSSNPWLHPLGFTQVFRRSLLRLSDLWPNSLDEHDSSQRLAHDQWFYFLAGTLGTIVYLDEPLVAYLQHASNTAFGWQRVAYRKSIKHFLRNRSDEYYRRSMAAGREAEILETAKERFEGVWAERASAAAEHYQLVSWLYAARSTLYSSSKLGDRLKAFREILEKGGYAGKLGLGSKSLVTDICMGLPIGHLLPINTEFE